MSNNTPSTDSAAGTLTDGKVVAPLTLKKLVKDFVADALIGAAASLAAAGVVGVPTDEATAWVAINAAAVAVAGALYRAVLRWATAP